MSGKKVILTGATGMVGGCALRSCLENSDISRVTTIGRQITGIKHPKLREIQHENFLDFSSVSDELRDQDVALFCLGVYTGAVPDDVFREITVDYTVAFASALHNESPQVSFCFLSGQGADQTEKSRAAFARYKGAAEKALIDIGFANLHIFRPGYIYPVTPRKEPNVFYRIFRGLYPMIRLVYPNICVPSEDLARAMVHAGLYGTGEHKDPILENKHIRAMKTS